MAEAPGTSVPEPHQEIKDEPSILDTSFDLTSQAGGEGQIATTSTRQSQVGIENTSLIQTSSSEVVVAGGDFKNVNFGPHTSTSHFEARNCVNPTFYYHFHSAPNQEPSTSTVPGDATKAQSVELQEGYIRISDDTVMYNVAPIRKGTNVYEGYQEHVSKDGSLKKLPVAIKRIIPCTPRHRMEVQHLLTLASHPNIVRIIRSKEHETPHARVLYIVMELCSLQNLNDYLKENRENGTPFDFKKTLKFTKQLVKGMKHIHDNDIIHRDVKPENVLLSIDKSQLKFSDFGIGKQLRQGRTSTKTTVQGQGTTGYIAPETHFTDKVSKSSDIFSLGVTLFELWSNGLNPFGLDVLLREFNIISNKSPDFSGLLISGPPGNALVDLIKCMLQYDPHLRPKIDEVLKHISSISAKIKSGGELLSSLSLGTRTPCDVESIQKQSAVTYNFYNSNIGSVIVDHGTGPSPSNDLWSSEEVKDRPGSSQCCPGEEIEPGILCIKEGIFVDTNKPIKEEILFHGYMQQVSYKGDGKKLQVAIKRITQCKEKHFREVDHMAKLVNHPNIVSIMNSARFKTPHGLVLYIVMELCSPQNLQTYWDENRKAKASFDTKLAMSISTQLIEGVKYVHEKDIIHRDIKPDNILIGPQGKEIKLCDFGLGKQLDKGRSRTMVSAQSQGTRGYMAPEVHSLKDITKQADIFSLGIVLFGVWSNGKHPFGPNCVKQDNNILDNKRGTSGLLIKGKKKKRFLDLQGRMLQHRRDDRPPIEKVATHAFFGMELDLP